MQELEHNSLKAYRIVEVASQLLVVVLCIRIAVLIVNVGILWIVANLFHSYLESVPHPDSSPDDNCLIPVCRRPCYKESRYIRAVVFLPEQKRMLSPGLFAGSSTAAEQVVPVALLFSETQTLCIFLFLLSPICLVSIAINSDESTFYTLATRLLRNS